MREGAAAWHGMLQRGKHEDRMNKAAILLHV